MIARRRGRGSRGFGLAEALVALVIAGGVLTAFYDAVSVGTALRSTVDRRAAQALQAYLLLDRLDREPALLNGFAERRSADGLSWDIRVTDQPPVGFLRPAALESGVLLHVHIAVAPVGRDDLVYRLHALRYQETPF